MTNNAAARVCHGIIDTPKDSVVEEYRSIKKNIPEVYSLSIVKPFRREVILMTKSSAEFKKMLNRVGAHISQKDASKIMTFRDFKQYNLLFIASRARHRIWSMSAEKITRSFDVVHGSGRGATIYYSLHFRTEDLYGSAILDKHKGEAKVYLIDKKADAYLYTKNYGAVPCLYQHLGGIPIGYN